MVDQAMSLPYPIYVVDRICGHYYQRFKPTIIPRITPLYLVCRQLYEETALLPLSSVVKISPGSLQAWYLLEYTLTDTQCGAIRHLELHMMDVQNVLMVLQHSCMPEVDGSWQQARLQQLCFPLRRLTGLKRVTVWLIEDIKGERPGSSSLINLPPETIRATLGIAAETKLDLEF
jgi:hypothetical protein